LYTLPVLHAYFGKFSDMIRLITIDDAVDLLHKFKQRGIGFILSKLNFAGMERTRKSFNQSDYEYSDWWIIPEIQQRWNKLITGNTDTDSVKYLVDTFLSDKSHLKLISLGSGICNPEIELARYSIFHEIVCVDISERRLQEAENTAKRLGLNNIKFVCADVSNYHFDEEYFDIAFFNQSLHHFDNIYHFIGNRIKKMPEERRFASY